MKQLPLDLGPEPDQRLARFVVGANAELLAHLQGLGPGEPPTLIWGGAGSGKTHLLHGLARQWREQGQAVAAFDAEARGRWELAPTVRLVLIDDVDRLDETQQHQAFALFIEAVGQGATVVATSRAPAVDLPLREDLRTRLGWGPSFALQPLDEGALRELLLQDGLRRGLQLPAELLDYLLLRFARDPAHLIPLLDRLDQYALRLKRAPTVPLLRQMLNEPDPV
ncbi:HdaA/DnaA family protein [Inhella proteolytica]|uniref:DnaA regulatory inactivator Hda n=1 Tax=Inhella proteolytica TaxID=2795029 RepID=A0A931J0H2_9BURK|nr:DnaA/Hda family protein [Inhella proteolytica]MBH9575398.1 DnaA regulatory inactivator Hda [Inhella proteolytica]